MIRWVRSSLLFFANEVALQNAQYVPEFSCVFREGEFPRFFLFGILWTGSATTGAA